MEKKSIILFAAIGLVLCFITFTNFGYPLEKGPKYGVEADLPLPHTLSLQDYERQFYTFLRERKYDQLGWKRDKKVRDTGPYIEGTNYGIHLAVRCFYSPEVMKWLKNGRTGEIPDGAIIIKEMFSTPAARWDGYTHEQLDSAVQTWTYMVKDSKGSKDGWFWGEYSYNKICNEPIEVDDYDSYPYAKAPDAGFGLYCARCHASAKTEMTFSALRNIEGEEGYPVIYRTDDSWKTQTASTTDPCADVAYEDLDEHSKLAWDMDRDDLIKRVFSNQEIEFQLEYERHFREVFANLGAVTLKDFKAIPPKTYDHIVNSMEGQQFFSSSQCMPCHSATKGKPNGYAMFSEVDGKEVNVSPFTEWSGSMMGLAGRDPIFFAQLESERTIHNKKDTYIQNTCFTCHGVMGKRQLNIDEPEADFKEDYVFIRDYEDKHHEYGALARDGISCMTCHTMVPDSGKLEDIENGNFHVSPKGAAGDNLSWLFGPFDNPPAHPMEKSLGLKPEKSEFISKSRLCASCHTVHLPVLNDKDEQVGDFYEQTTYIEWLNSSYQDELLAKGEMNPNTRSCQSCHMPGSYPFKDPEQMTEEWRIAIIQNQLYPEAEYLAPMEEITTEVRKNFRRHTLLGVNQFGLEFFHQFDSILGINTEDYMTRSKYMEFAIESGNNLAKNHSSRAAFTKLNYEKGILEAEVLVQNLAGHRLPSGVGFRRAFLEFEVKDKNGEVVWASGRTNNLGIIVGPDGKYLPTEFHEPLNGEESYQPHYDVITAQDQVQIYEELIKSPEPERKFTTSFLSLDKVVKDNRLLPHGWTEKGPGGFRFQEQTMPHGKAENDPNFVDGTGSDRVTYRAKIPREKVEGGTVSIRMYYQAIPPNYLKSRFTSANGGDTKRLFYLVSNLNTQGTNIESWKLLLAETTVPISL